jgi:dipeptidyl aminopeptidase/acylaminoacyl peptidase
VLPTCERLDLLKKTAPIFLAAAIAAWAARPPFITEDWWAWRFSGDPRIAPGGEWVVYQESWNHRAADAVFSNLWLVSSNGKTRRPLTQGNWRDTSPRWSPDGARVAWLSDRTGSPQIWVGRWEEGGETRGAVATPGQGAARTGRATPDKAGTRGQAGAQGAVAEQSPADPRSMAAQAPAAARVTTGERPLSLAWSPDGESIAFTALAPMKTAPPVWAPPAILPRLHQPREGYLHLFLAPASGGAARQISSGNFDYTGEPAWMPDGRSILMSRDGEIYSIRLADGAARQLTREGGRNLHPLPSSDGAKIAWLATGDQSQSYAVRKVCVMNADGSRVKVLSGSLDRDATDPQWSSDSRTVYFLADDRGSTHVYAARNDGTVRQATSAPERLWGFSLADNGRAVAVRSTPSESGGVYTFTVDRVSQPVVLHTPNEHLLAERESGALEEIDYPSGANTIQAWMVKPPDFDAAGKYPLLLDIRDHPRAMCGVDFNLRAQIFAARGFVVLCVNPRGTPGYGEVFGNLLPTRNPGDDYDDLMAGVDFVVAKGYVDARRLTVAGGVLAAWTIGHTDRFRSAVVTHLAGDWGAKPWGDAQNLKTPALVLADDPDPASEALYAALQSRKVGAALARMGTAAKPGEQILELEAILAWLAR